MKKTYVLPFAASIFMQWYAMNAFAADFSKLLDQIDSARTQNNVPGLGLTIVSDQEVIHEEYLGFADLENKVIADNETIFRIGSITKTFTSLAILRLVEQGKLALDDEVSKHLKELPFQNTFASPIRVAHLLEHTAGFRGLTAKEFDFKQPNWSVKDSLAYDATSRTTAWQPGMYSSYTNSGAGVAALLIEEVSQQSYEEFVNQQIFKPLGFTDATFFFDEKNKLRLATGYDRDGNSQIPYWHMLYRSFGGINMRVSEMAVFVQMLISQGYLKHKEVFSKASIQRMETPSTSLAARNDLTYGYGLGNYQWMHKGVLFYGHGGDADGYLAHYGYSRENNMGYFVVINAFNNRALGQIRQHIESWLVRDMKHVSFPTVSKLTSKETNDIVGTYESITERFPEFNPDKKRQTEGKLKIFESQGKLFTQLAGNKAKQLIPVNNHHYRRMNQPVATISIVRDEQGNPVLQGDIGNFRKIK